MLRASVLKLSALIMGVLVITSFAAVLTVLMPISSPFRKSVDGFSSSASSVSIFISDSKWIINPGGTFTVYVGLLNNENAPLENVDVYAYVFEGSNVLNVGGWQSNKTTISLAPNENENVALEITIKENAVPGIYNLRARAKLSDDTTYDETENIYVENTGIHLKMGSVLLVNFAGGGVFISATAANLTSDNLENIEVFSHIYRDEQVVNENGWEGNKQENSLSAGEIKNFYFALKILENIDSGDYVLRTRLRLPDNTLFDDNRPLRIVSLAGIKRKLDALENGIITRAENFLNLFYVGRGQDNLIKLNEVYANIVGPDDGNEWIEIYNTSQENLGWAGVRIGSWKVADDEGTLATVPLGTILQPDEYYVFEGLGGLSNTGENIWLINDKGEVIDHLEYTLTVEGRSLARMPNASDNWVDNAELTKCRNNDDNSEGAAYLPKIDLEGIKTVARELRFLLIENAQELVLANADTYDTLQYINQHGSGITKQDAEGVVKYIQTYGKLLDNFRQNLLDQGLTENDVLEIEDLIKENPDDVINGAPSLGLEYLRMEYTKTIQAFIDTVAASLHIEVAASVERQLQDPGLSGEEYVAGLDNRWDATSSDLAEARAYDNVLYEAMKDENWQVAYDNANAFMIFAENRALEIVDEIHLAGFARVYFRENGTFDNVRYAAEKELQFTKALDRFLYFYQKGLYFKMATLAALNGDNEQALDEAANARNMPFTVDVGSLVWQPLKDAPGIANMAAEVAQSNGNWYVYVARLYQHHLDRYRIGTTGWTTTASLSENAWGWDAGASLSYAENGGMGYIYALMGGDTREFWRYDLTNDSWDNLGFTPNFVSAGGSLILAGENVLYATRGKSSTEFWLYHIENNTWDNTCLAPALSALETGAGLMWDSGDKLYTFKGGGSISFYRYSISGNSWSPVTAAPAGVGAGASLEWAAPYIWATRGGGTTDLWRYNPDNDLWENMPSTPATVGTRAGRRLVQHEDYLYLPRGETDEQFWRFKLKEPSVTVEELLTNPSAYDNKQVWVSGFISNYMRKETWDNRYYSIFDLTTYEGVGAGVDNTRYYQGENIDTSDADNVTLKRISAGDHLLISEVYPNPTVAYDRTEFAELYNPTSSDVNLDGYSLYEETTEKITFTSNDIIPAHGFFLVADGQYSGYKDQENADWPEPDATAAWALSNSGDAVILFGPDGNVVDVFGYATTDNYESEPFQSTPAEGSTAERYSSSARDPSEDSGNSFDTDNNAYDFFEQSIPNPENSSFTEDPPAGGYESEGYLESAIYDAGILVNWDNVTWVETKSADASIIVEVRTGNSSTIDNTWTAWENVANGQNIGGNSRYIQYRAKLSTTDDSVTPVLHEIRIYYLANGQVEEWVQSDWSGGDGLELWSAQQRLRIYCGWGHVDVSQGAGENSYSVLYGTFYASHEVTGDPQLNMLGVKLFVDGKVVPTDTPECWEIYEPWGAAGYVGSSSITRGWGWATYFAEELKGIREGALFAAFTTLEDAFGEYTAFWDIIVGAICQVVTAVVTAVVVVVCPPLAPLAWAGMEYLSYAASEAVADWERSCDVRYCERDYNWDYGMDRDYDWDDCGWGYDGDDGGMDGWDAGC